MPIIQRPRNIDEKLLAMQAAKIRAEHVLNNNMILAYSTETYNKLLSFLPIFEKEVDEVKRILDNQTESMWLIQKNLSLLRMHVTHFIKVFNFAVERGHFSPLDRSFYGIDVNSENLPYIKGEADTIMWVKKLINGEKTRQEKGGKEMCNPSIDEIAGIFKKYSALQEKQNSLKADYSKGFGDIGILINEADELLRDIWDEVEFFYRKEADNSRHKLCREYGLVYIDEQEGIEKDVSEG